MTQYSWRLSQRRCMPRWGGWSANDGGGASGAAWQTPTRPACGPWHLKQRRSRCPKLAKASEVALAADCSVDLALGHKPRELGHAPGGRGAVVALQLIGQKSHLLIVVAASNLVALRLQV